MTQPAAPQPPHRSTPARQQGLPAWFWWLLGLVLVGVIAALYLVLPIISTGWNAFKNDAQAALQQQPAVVEHIGQIQDMDLDLLATHNAKGLDEFVFRLRGDRGEGTVQASFISHADTEEITEGTLRMNDGNSYPLIADVQPPSIPESPEWDTFVANAQTALQQQAVVDEHIGQIQDMELNVDATNDSPNPDEFSFYLRGDHGEGIVQAIFITRDAGEEITEGTLRMGDGRSYPLSASMPRAAE